MSSTSESARSLEIFYSYAHEDERLRKALDKHLSLLKRDGLISDWYDHKITAGKEWASEILTHLDSAQIILSLVSPDFIASDYCYSVEMQRAMERHELGDACVIPIILQRRGGIKPPHPESVATTWSLALQQVGRSAGRVAQVLPAAP
jgi:hypothetical protein